MQPSPRSGFQLTDEGIQYWFIDAENVANFVGAVAFLELIRPCEFILQTTKGLRRPICLLPHQIAEFRRHGGVIKRPTEPGSSDRSTKHYGFQRTDQGVFFWFQGKDKVRSVGPIVVTEHLQNDRYAILTKDGRHIIRLNPTDLAEFERLGGMVKRQLQIPGHESTESAVSQEGPGNQKNRSGGRELQSTPRKGNLQALSWRGKGKCVKFGRYSIADPLTYFSQGRPSEEEASCIDLTLPVGERVIEERGALGYWPEYGRISPNQRANYLAWLADGRDRRLDDIGYAFIYFYGLERRVLVESQDINAITLEVIRLLDCYTLSGSFTGYLSRFLAYVIARTGLEKLRQEWFNHIFNRSSIQPGEEILALALAWYAKRSQPLSPDWAMRMAREHPQASRSVVVNRVPKEFEALFAKKFRDRFGDGFVLRAAQRDRIVDYKQPASPSLLNLRNRNSEFAGPVRIPNVLGLQSQFLPLVKIWDECIEELKPLSRHMAKGGEANSRSVYEALPDELKAERDYPDKPKWDAIVANHTSEDGYVIVPMCEMATILGFTERRKLTPKQSESVAQTADYLGYCIEPDCRLTRRPYVWQDIAALFRLECDSEVPRDNRYLGAALILEMGLAVAAADGVITDGEIVRIRHFLEGQFVLDQAEVKRLKQLEQVFLRQHPVLSRVSKRLLKSVSQTQREMLGRFLFGVAAADGSINAMTLKALRSAYRAIGVDVSQLNSLLAELRTTKQPEETNDTKRLTDEEQPPGRPEMNLNQDLIRQIMADTQAVAGMLSQVFAQEDDDVDDEPLGPTNTVATMEFTDTQHRDFPGLQDRFLPLVADLLARDEWPKGEFDKLVRARGLMPADAMSRINEWAEENLGDFLIEEGEPLLIHRHLIRENV